MCLRIMLKPADFEPLDVEQHRFVRWRSQQSIRPPALIERSPMKDRFAVERESPMAVCVFGFANGANSRVGLDSIDVLAGGIEQSRFDVVKMRRCRRPEFRIGDFQCRVSSSEPVASATTVSPSFTTTRTLPRTSPASTIGRTVIVPVARIGA